jgi:hypothetical protein
MKFKVVYNPDFYEDIVQAVDWYNEKQPCLGDKLFDAVKKLTKKLTDSALHYAIRYDDIRCMPIENFFYVMHYRVDERTKVVKIEALFHSSRNPGLWGKRTH